MTSLREALRVWRWPLSAYFVLLIGLFVAAAVSTALYVNAQTERDARRAAQAEARFAAQTAAKELGTQLQLTQTTVAQLASNPGITQVFSQSQPCSLTFGGIAGPDRSHLDVVRADGVVACTSRPQTGSEPRRYDQAEWMQQALAGPIFVAPARDSATGAWVAVSAAPIPPGKGAVVAFVELTPVAPHLASLYSGPEPAEFLIASGDGATVISRSLDAKRSVGASLAGTPFARAGGAVERTDLDGTSRLYAEAPVAGVDWRLLVGKDKASALAAGKRLERRQLAIISIGLLAVLLAAWLVHRKLVSPIRRLSDALRKSTAETEPSPVAVSGPAELSALGQDVNALISTVNRELHERRRAEESARESERNYRLLFESNPNPMWVYDSETLRFLAVNEAALRSYGFAREEFLTMTIEDIRPAEDVPQLQALVGPDGPGPDRGLVTAGFWRHCRKDGTVFDVDVTSHAHVFDGRPARVVLAVDVTARIEAERALRHSEARYRDLFENASDLIAMVDLDSRLTMVNEAFVRGLGYTREELIGRPLRELVPPEQHELLEKARIQKLGEVEATTYEHELVAKDGHRIHVEVATRLIDVDGQPLGVEAICRDITERRHLEEQLRQAQRLEAIGRLAGGIAHDFNNLLTVISGYTDALLEQGDPDSEDELKEISAAAERATILTRQLLAFSRRQVLQPRTLDLNEVVQGVIPMLTRLIGEDIDLVTSLDPELDHVVADPNQLEQVVLNLVINARDAMPGGGKLTIATGTTEFDESYVAEHPEARVGRHASLSVSDNGVGMDADTVARVFEPFFTTKPVGTGTGLGLSTVYGIVKQSGGNIWVYSEPGRGSAFKVYLPAAEESLAAAAPARPQIAAPTGTETILVVEDEDAVRTLAASMLERSGYTVLATRSAEEALRIAGDPETPIDLLLTDLVMPEMSGRELASKIVEQLPDIRVLFMSGYADEAVTRHGALDPGTAYLEKPFSARDLARMVRKTLDDASAATRQHVA